MTENTTNKNNNFDNTWVVKTDKYPELKDTELEIIAGGINKVCTEPMKCPIRMSWIK